MDGEQFWALIEAARAATGGDCKQQAAHLDVVSLLLAGQSRLRQTTAKARRT
jgi:hypothetical protein